MEKRHKTRIRISDYYYNRIAVMNGKSTHTILESNVRERHSCERNLTRRFGKLERNLKGNFEKLRNFNKVSYQEVVKTLKDVNFKLGTKIKSENDEIILDF
jgi:DNA-directed RNA polymerase alpha subunit